MIKYSKLKRKGCFLLLAFFLMVPPVYAYLDPGSGSMLLQVLIGGVAAALFSVKIYWKKIKEKLTKIFSIEKESSDDGPINKEDENNE